MLAKLVRDLFFICLGFVAAFLIASAVLWYFGLWTLAFGFGRY